MATELADIDSPEAAQEHASRNLPNPETILKGKPMTRMGDAFKNAIESGSREKKLDKLEERVEMKKSPIDSILSPSIKEVKEESSSGDPFKDLSSDDLKNNAKLRKIAEEAHGKVKALQDEVAKLAEQAKGASGLDDLKKEIQDKQTKLDEMQAYVRAADITRDPEFRAKYIDGRSKLVDRAIAKITDAGVNADDLKEALSLTGKKRSDAIKSVLSGLDEYERGKVDRIIDQVDELDEQREEAMRDSGKTWESLSKSKQDRMVEERSKSDLARAAEIESTISKIPETFIMLRKADPAAENAENWNKDIANAHDKVKYLLGGDAPVSEVASAIAKGLLADKLQEHFLSERAARIKAEESIGQYRKASPSFKGGREPSSEKRNSWERPLGEVFEEVLGS